MHPNIKHQPSGAAWKKSSIGQYAKICFLVFGSLAAAAGNAQAQDASGHFAFKCSQEQAGRGWTEEEALTSAKNAAPAHGANDLPTLLYIDAKRGLYREVVPRVRTPGNYGFVGSLVGRLRGMIITKKIENSGRMKSDLNVYGINSQTFWGVEQVTRDDPTEMPWDAWIWHCVPAPYEDIKPPVKGSAN